MGKDKREVLGATDATLRMTSKADLGTSGDFWQTTVFIFDIIVTGDDDNEIIAGEIKIRRLAAGPVNPVDVADGIDHDFYRVAKAFYGDDSGLTEFIWNLGPFFEDNADLPDLFYIDRAIIRSEFKRTGLMETALQRAFDMLPFANRRAEPMLGWYRDMTFFTGEPTDDEWRRPKNVDDVGQDSALADFLDGKIVPEKNSGNPIFARTCLPDCVVRIGTQAELTSRIEQGDLRRHTKTKNKTASRQPLRKSA